MTVRRLLACAMTLLATTSATAALRPAGYVGFDANGADSSGTR